jgi:hypothetical protein
MSTARQQVMADAVAGVAACDRPVRCGSCSAREGRDVYLPAWQFTDKMLARGQLRCIACNRAASNAGYAKRKAERALLAATHTVLMDPGKFYTGPTGPALYSVRYVYETF